MAVVSLAVGSAQGEERPFRALADTIPQLVWMADADGRITWYNRRWYEYTGSTFEQMEGWGWQSVHDPEELPRVLVSWTASIASGDPFEMVFPLRGRDGVFRPFLTRVEPEKDASGCVVRWFGTNTDITEQVRIEQRLRDSETRLRLALSAGRGIGTWNWDVVADRVIADERFAGLYGVDPATAEAGAPIADFFALMHPDDAARVRASIEVALTTGAPFSEEYRLVPANGVERWVVAEGRCERSADGAPLRFPGVSFDITDRKDAESRLRELNADLERKVIERSQERGKTWQVSPDLMGALNGQGYFETSNPAWKVVLGWTEEEVASRSIFELLHPDDVERTRDGFNLTHDGRPAIRFPNRFRCKDGSYRWISWVGVPDGGITYCSGRDITEEIERDEALQRAESALRQSQKMEAVGQLTGGLAHDFNNLLAGISGSLEVIQMRISQGRIDAVERYLSAAKNAVKRAAALTHRLLAFSRRQTLDPKPTNVNRLVAEMEDLVRRTVGPSVHVEVVGAGALWPTLVDPNQLENALLNLCINARDAMPQGGRLTIETANRSLDEAAAQVVDLPPGAYVVLCVTDTGVGMTPNVAGKAFDPFFTTKPMGEGTGLGLSMVYGFARQSGGQARIHSKPGAGTSMWLYLPRHDREADPDEPLAAKGRADPIGDGEVVLLIDDEPTIRMVITEVLEEAGFSAIEASDGPSGLRVLQSPERIDLLITDVGLPGGMNGRQVADAARALRPELKVLFITGYAENAVVGNGPLEKGMSIMTKPFAVEDLARKIREIVAG
ncbi:MAG: PAS domain-containing protein [Caldimonas sp.]